MRAMQCAREISGWTVCHGPNTVGTSHLIWRSEAKFRKGCELLLTLVWQVGIYENKPRTKKGVMPAADAEIRTLRDVVACIERRGCGADKVRARRIVSLADEPLALDQALGGGLSRGTLQEIMAAGARDAAATAGFALALVARCVGDGPLIWIVDDRVAWETGMPYGPGLAAYGLDPAKLLLVRTRDAQTTLWAAEEALRAGTGVVLTELWRGQAYDLAASRRLLLAARRRNTTGLLLHVGIGSEVVSSAADTRFAVAAIPGDRRPSAGGHKPVPGRPSFAVRLLKRRGGAGEAFRAFDRDAVHTLLWDSLSRSFRSVGRTTPLRHAPLTPSWQDRSVWLEQGGTA